MFLLLKNASTYSNTCLSLSKGSIAGPVSICGFASIENIEKGIILKTVLFEDIPFAKANEASDDGINVKYFWRISSSV